MRGDAYEFPVPTVEYTVPEPEQKPEQKPGEPTKPSADNTKKPVKKAKGGVPKTGDATMPAVVAGLLVAGVAAGAAGVAASSISPRVPRCLASPYGCARHLL